MSGWGPGSFENDDAQGCLPELSALSLDGLRPLLTRAADNADYLEAPQSSLAIVAAEVIAALRGAPAQALPREIVQWVNAGKTSVDPNSIADASVLALRAVQRVRTDSELKDLWLQADGLNEWSANLRDLEKRLAS